MWPLLAWVLYQQFVNQAAVPTYPGAPNVRQMNTRDFQSLPAPGLGAHDGCVYMLANSVMMVAGSHRGILKPCVSWSCPVKDRPLDKRAKLLNEQKGFLFFFFKAFFNKRELTPQVASPRRLVKRGVFSLPLWLLQKTPVFWWQFQIVWLQIFKAGSLGKHMGSRAEMS